MNAFLWCFVSLFVAVDAFGSAGNRTVSKMASLLLGAIGIMMVRRGVLEAIAQATG